MKKGLFLLVGGIVLIVSIFLIFFYSWNYFNKREPKVNLNTLEIVLSDDGNVDLKDQTPVNDDSGKSVKPYSFRVVNKSNVKAKYQLLIEDYISDDTKELLSRNYLKYELKQDGIVIKSGKLSEINNNILDADNISSQEEKKYELRVWVDESANATDWVGKSYNYNVRVNPVVN